MNSQELYPCPPIAEKPRSVDTVCQLDIRPLLDLLARFPDPYWQQENAKKANNYPVFHSTEHLILRFIEEGKDPRFFYETPAWRLFASSALPLMDQISACMGISTAIYPKAMFARLKAGGHIDPHIDKGVPHPYVQKIHVPLISHPDVEFIVGDSSFFLEPGMAYEVNNLVEHAVNNRSGIDRIHFIFEVYDQTTKD